MISKLPKWIWAGAWALAFVAGFVNVIGLLGFQHQAVTHLTGTASLLAEAMSDLQSDSILHFAAVLGSFVFGCVVSGFIVEDSTLRLGRRYGVALLMESVLFAAAVPLLDRNNIWGIYLTSCACGLQNAMVSTYSGSVVRTTHLSGMFTDLGIFLGHWLRGIRVDARRVRLCGTVISAFICGGVAGTWGFHLLKYHALFIPAALSTLAAAGYAAYRFLKRSPVDRSGA
ncbi:MAG TPA: YoaK family protein [Verrucomicrobiales bacterium]|nr:YoaK family protein [Verrucomicrobiales bacterium]